jgi:UDP-glucuronate 4-epimerase
MNTEGNIRKRILVTGAAGFIGAHLARRLTRLGYEVTGVDNLNHYYSPLLKRARLDTLCDSSLFRFYQMDIADDVQMSRLFAEGGFEGVVHLAAQAGVRYSIDNPKAYVDSNVVGFMNVLEGVRRNPCDHLVFASSSSVYGANSSVPFREEDSTDHPVSLYAATKKSNEVFAHAYSHLYGIPMTGLRFFTVYGPWGRPDMAIFKFVKAILSGETIQLYNQGKLSRDFTYIDDIIEGIVRVLPIPPEAQSEDTRWSAARLRLLNIGNNRPVELFRLVHVIESALGVEAIVNLAPMQQGDVYTTYASVDELAALTGYNPTVSIEQGVVAFVNWYRSDYEMLMEERGTALQEPQESVA